MATRALGSHSRPSVWLPGSRCPEAEGSEDLSLSLWTGLWLPHLCPHLLRDVQEGDVCSRCSVGHCITASPFPRLIPKPSGHVPMLSIRGPLGVHNDAEGGGTEALESLVVTGAGVLQTDPCLRGQCLSTTPPATHHRTGPPSSPFPCQPSHQLHREASGD